MLCHHYVPFTIYAMHHFIFLPHHLCLRVGGLQASAADMIAQKSFSDEVRRHAYHRIWNTTMPSAADDIETTMLTT